MATFQTTHKSVGYLGGFEYRATSNGTTAHIQSRKAGANAWKTEASCNVQTFKALAEQFGLESPYGGNSQTVLHSMSRHIAEQ